MKIIFSFLKRKYNLIIYFVSTVCILGSVGVWLPMLIDWFIGNSDPKGVGILSKETYRSTPNNIITYFLSVFSIAVIDRVLHIIDKKDYKYRKTEILVSLVVIGLVGFFVLKSFRFIRLGDIDSAISFSIYGAVLSYVIWWIANYHDTRSDPDESLGGNPEKSLANG